MTRIHKYLVCLLAAAMLAAIAGMTSACGFLPEEEEILAPPLMEPATIEYKTTPVERGTIVLQTRMSGSFNPEIQKSLSFTRQGGRIGEVYARAGKTVEEGELLMELDSSDLEFQISMQEIEVEKAELNLSRARANGADNYTVRGAELDLLQQELRLEDLQKQLEATRIYAPFAGDVTYMTSKAAGEYVSAYEIVARVADTSSLVLVTISDSAANLPIGAEVEIEYDREYYSGEVVANPSTLINDPDERMRRAAIIRLTGKMPEEIRMGSDARIIFIQETREDVLIIPRKYINLMSGRRFVNALEDGVRIEKDVEVGLMTDIEAEIVSGLEEGDLIIVN